MVGDGKRSTKQSRKTGQGKGPITGGEEGVGPDRDHSALGSIAGHRELRPSESLVSILSLIMPFLETTKKKPRQSKTMAT